MFTLWQGTAIVLLLNVLLAWWLFRYGREWICQLRGLCPECFAKDGLCVCRPDLDEPAADPVWTIDLTLWDDLSDEERAEAERADADDRGEAGGA